MNKIRMGMTVHACGNTGYTFIYPLGTKFPAEGNLEFICKQNNINVYQFQPCQSGTWVNHAFFNVTPIEGAVVIDKVYDDNIEENDEDKDPNHSTLLLMSKYAVVMYDERVVVFSHGREICPTSDRLLEVGFKPTTAINHIIDAPPEASEETIQKIKMLEE